MVGSSAHAGSVRNRYPTLRSEEGPATYWMRGGVGAQDQNTRTLEYKLGY